jgi:hypothetical protein
MRINPVSLTWRNCFVALTAIGVAAGTLCDAVHAQNAGPPIDFQKSGIRFQIKAQIEPVPVPSNSNDDADRRRASLDVKLRISAHAIGSSFYGVIPQYFADFPLADGSDERLFWQDAQCHQRRGLPKIAIVAIDGTIRTKEGQAEVSAQPRHIGMLLPKDEISAASRLPSGADKTGRFLAFRSVTSASHLSVKVTVYTIDCSLNTAPPIAGTAR